MALVIADRVKETTTSTGTGTITLAGAAAGYQSFAAVGNGNTTYYAIVDTATGAWEVGIGTYSTSGPTLARTTVLSSSNSNALVSFGAGSKDVFVTLPASKSVPAPIKQPVNISPANNASEATGKPTLTGAYFSLYGLTMAAGQWQVSTSSSFNSFVVNTGDVAGTSASYQVPYGLLATSTTYYWRCRFKDVDGNYSEWSSPTTFVTSAAFGPAIGEAYGGGYYAGRIKISGVDYFLVVSPAASGDAQKRYASLDGYYTTFGKLNDGAGNQASMGTDTRYEAAQWCKTLTIGGYNDWYMPSRDELELIYRNFKPTTAANATTARDIALQNNSYTETKDVSGDTMGINRHSVPNGAAYTASSPAQTSVAAFQSGGSEALSTSGNYFSSTSSYSTGAGSSCWGTWFSSGAQYASVGVNGMSNRVRAVRKVAA